jgi:hypothetical protein
MSTSKTSGHYEYELIAGSRAHPQGWIGQYRTKDEAEQARPLRYAAFIRRVLVKAA